MKNTAFRYEIGLICQCRFNVVHSSPTANNEHKTMPMIITTASTQLQSSAM